MVNLTKFGFGAGLLPLIALPMFLSEANADRNDDTPVLDVDASGTVTPLTDGLMILRSMFGFTGDALTDSAVDLTNCQDCDSEEIEKYIADVRGLTFGKINSVDDQNISGSALNGKTLTIGIEDGDSESVDLSGLLDGVGVTSGQASAITANTAKTGITSDQASAITANTAKTGVTADQDSAITANTAKTGITSGQASAITVNTAKTGITSGQASAITANSAKTGITSGQASAISANTAKTGITSDQASAITANTAKTGITTDQASAITANTAKIGTDGQNISGSGLSGTTLTIGIQGGNNETVELASLTESGFSVVPFSHAEGVVAIGNSNVTTIYFQIVSEKTMTISKISFWGSSTNSLDTILAGVYRGELGNSSSSVGGTLIGQGASTNSVGSMARTEISLSPESGQSLNIAEMEALIIGMHVAACEGDWSPWVMCPDAFKFGQNDNLMRGEFASRATMPATPTAGQRGSPYCKPVSWVH